MHVKSEMTRRTKKKLTNSRRALAEGLSRSPGAILYARRLLLVFAWPWPRTAIERRLWGDAFFDIVNSPEASKQDEAGGDGGCGQETR